MKCFAVLFSHMVGFAAINGFGTMQQLSFFSKSWQMCLALVPIAAVLMFAWFKVLDTLRAKIAYGDDGVEDEFEKAWDAETEEAENDIAGLSLSFLTVQTMRLAISGILPNQEGEEEEGDTMW